MKVVQISSKWDRFYSTLGLARDYRAALIFLMNKGYLRDKTLVWTGPYLGNISTLEDHFGEDWCDRFMEKWDIGDFNSFFDNDFSPNAFRLTEIEVYDP